MMMLRTTIVNAVVVLTVFSSVVVQVVEAESRIVGGNNAAKGQYPYYGMYAYVSDRIVSFFVYFVLCVVRCALCVKEKGGMRKI